MAAKKTPPRIQSFTANPAVIVAGQLSTLSATVTGSQPITLTLNGVAASLPLTVTPTTTTTYTLKATNRQGSATATATVTVTTVVSTHFSVSAPMSVVPGQAFNVTVTARDSGGTIVPTYTGTVHMTSTDGSAVLPADFQLNNGTKSVSVTFNGSGTFTLTATDTVTASITGTSAAIVCTGVPVITNFIATPSSIAPGASSVLSATVTGSTNLTLDGTFTTLPATVTPASTHTYTLIASNNAGSTSATVTVTVAAPSLTTASSNPTGETITVYQPTDRTDGRVWIRAPLRAANGNYFQKWQQNGVDFDTASVTSFVLNASYTMTAVYATPSSSGVTVNPGTNSLAAAMVGQPAGTTYLLKAGIHRFTAFVSPRVGDTIQGENGAICRGTKVITFAASGGNWVAAGQTQDFYAEHNAASPTACSSLHPLCYRYEELFLDDVQYTPVGSIAALGPGKFFFDYPNDNIWISDDPTGKTAETTTGTGGLIGYSTNDSVTLRNFVVERFGGGGEASAESFHAIKTYTHWLLEAMEICYNSSTGVIGGGTIRNCYIHHNGQYGIVGTPALLEGCEFSFNNTNGFDPFNDASNSKFLHSTNISVRGNYVHNNYGNGFWQDFDNKGSIYENNWITDNQNYGIDDEANCFTTIRYNYLNNNNLAWPTYPSTSIYWNGNIYSRMSVNVEYYGNDITSGSGRGGITINGDTSGGLITSAQCGTFGSTSVYVHDNWMRLSTGSLVGYVGPVVSASVVTFANNHYKVPTLNGTFFCFPYTPVNWTTWQSYGQDLNGTITT